MNLQSKFIKFMTEYRGIFEKVWRTGVFKDDFGNFVRHDIADELGDIARSYNSVYSSKGSVGQTKWTPVPWLAIFDNRITRKATEGEYVVYLLNSETKELYLTFNQASEEKNNAEVRKNLQKKANQIRSRLSFPSGVSFEPIHSGNAAYDAGCICSIKYSLGQVPDDSILKKDLSTFLDIYSQYYEAFYEMLETNKWWPSQSEYPLNLSKDDWKKYILEIELPKHPSPMKMLKGMLELGGEASCKQLSDTYGGHPSVYAGCAMNLGRRVKKYFDLPACMDGDQERYFPFPFIGKYRGGNEDNYIYKIRPELLAALNEIDLSAINPQYEESAEGVKEMTTKEQIGAIKKFIMAKGFNYDGSLVENFYLSLKSKPFVILAGTSGTGKTRLVRLFAEAIGAKYHLVSVRPDWSDSSDLFGHIDLNGVFKKGAIIDFLKNAIENPEIPHILCLDEMNLARVEYYMSDILSVLETREFDEHGKINTQPLISENYCRWNNGKNEYGEMKIPGNFYIVGTVNMDETTFPFSKKVLDRANTIEFSYVDLLSMPSFSKTSSDKIAVTNEFLVSKYITLNDCAAVDKDYIHGICTILSRINLILAIANAHIGYRVRDEIVFYMLNSREANLLDDKIALDNQIMQKILPRIQGSSESVKKMLEELKKLCISEKFESSAKKIDFMIMRYDEDGFTSYWL